MLFKANRSTFIHEFAQQQKFHSFCVNTADLVLNPTFDADPNLAKWHGYQIRHTVWRGNVGSEQVMAAFNRRMQLSHSRVANCHGEWTTSPIWSAIRLPVEWWGGKQVSGHGCLHLSDYLSISSVMVKYCEVASRWVAIVASITGLIRCCSEWPWLP